MFPEPIDSRMFSWRDQRRLRWQRGASLAVMGVLGVCAGLLMLPACDRTKPAPPPPTEAPAAAPEPVRWPLGRLQYPTAQTNWFDAPLESWVQPTASGRVESGLYGSTRTANSGGRIHPSFHEGLDIQPVERDRAGRPLDDVRAAADGRVAYINRHSGNSNYGIYVALTHDDAVGEVYTFYSHLLSVADSLRAGQTVAAGDVLGRLGNTPPRIIPMARAHLHFEIGVVINQHFDGWMKSRKTRNDHGMYNGWNLLGIDPLAVYADQRDQGETFTLLDHLRALPVAAELVLPARRLPDYYTRYPALWEGDAFTGPALVVAISEGGVPLRGRMATTEEAGRLKGRSPVVLTADAEVLGRNGRRLVVAAGDGWAPGSQAARWADILLYGAE